MKIQVSLLALSIMVASGSQAMQALDDSSMSDVTGQAGITIEQTTTGDKGLIFETDEIKYTQADTAGKGEVALTIDGYSVSSYIYDETQPDNYGGNNTIRHVIDIDEDGNLSIKTRDVNTRDIKQGAFALGGHRFNSGTDINAWRYADGSYTELEVMNELTGARIVSRTVMKEGSGYNQIVHENDVLISTDIVYLPKDGEDAFVSEVIVTTDSNGLKLELGETRGSMEINNLSILAADGTNLFGEGTSFWDQGYTDMTVERGTTYLTIGASTEPTKRNGIEGKIAADFKVADFFYRTDSSRIAAKDVRVNTGGELNYTMEFKDYGRMTGMELNLTSANEMNFSLGGITFADAEGEDESASLGSLAVSKLKLGSQGVQINLYPDSSYGKDGIRQDITANGATSFDIELYDEEVGINAPKLTASVVINDFSQAQTINHTSKGIRINTITNSMDVNVNSIKAGNNQVYKGQTGRLVMNNLHQVSGGYTNIEPLR